MLTLISGCHPDLGVVILVIALDPIGQIVPRSGLDHGKARQAALNSSRRRVKAFSSASDFTRSASHSSQETVLCRSMVSFRVFVDNYVDINLICRMSSDKEPCYEITLKVRDACLCLHLQRAARAVARRFDNAFRPLDLTNGQFSLLMSLNRPRAPSIGDVSRLLAMDRTTLTANLKPLERRGLVEVTADHTDHRTHRLSLTPAGHELLLAAASVWRQTHAAVDCLVLDADRLRGDLRALSCDVSAIR